MNWSDWKLFPDPRSGGFLTAPLGSGCYELRNRKSDELVLFGMSSHVALRMTSLIPSPDGRGGRNNGRKRSYVFENIGDIEYRTMAFNARNEAQNFEKNELKSKKSEYIFPT